MHFPAQRACEGERRAVLGGPFRFHMAIAQHRPVDVVLNWPPTLAKVFQMKLGRRILVGIRLSARTQEARS